MVQLLMARGFLWKHQRYYLEKLYRKYEQDRIKRKAGKTQD